VKNDADFDVSPKLTVRCKLNLSFPHFTSVVCFPALYKGIMSSRAFHHFHVLSRLTLHSGWKKVQTGSERNLLILVNPSLLHHTFLLGPARLTAPRLSVLLYLFSRALHRLHDSRAFHLHGLHVFRRSIPLAYFPALNTFCIFLLRVLIGSLDFCRRNVEPIPCPVSSKR